MREGQGEGDTGDVLPEGPEASVTLSESLVAGSEYASVSGQEHDNDNEIAQGHETDEYFGTDSEDRRVSRKSMLETRDDATDQSS